MVDIRELIIFIFVLLLIFNNLRLLYKIRQKKDKSYIFIIMICGLFLLATGIFLDLIGAMINEYYIHIIVRLCLRVGSLLVVIGIILWGEFTQNMINELEKVASMDAMTGTLNRKGLEKVFGGLIKTGKQFYFVACDLDGTKLINDTFGYIEGDKFICITSQIMMDSVGKNGCVSRLCGDEFIILMENSIAVEIEEIISEIKEKISRQYPRKKIGVSIGYASFPEDGKSYEDLARKADSEMCEEKRRKRSYLSQQMR